MKCPQCGVEISDKISICPKCFSFIRKKEEKKYIVDNSINNIKNNADKKNDTYLIFFIFVIIFFILVIVGINAIKNIQKNEAYYFYNSSEGREFANILRGKISKKYL